MNELFAGWVETVYHARVHSETGQRPLERFLAAGPPALPTRQMLHEAFLWSHLGTQAVNRGMSLDAIAALLGHRDLSMTKVYANPRELHQAGANVQVAC